MQQSHKSMILEKSVWKSASLVGSRYHRTSFAGEDTRKETDMPYVDGFILAVPKTNLDAYKALAHRAGKVWREHGALSYVESIGDDVPYGELTSFPRAVQAEEGE